MCVESPTQQTTPSLADERGANTPESQYYSGFGGYISLPNRLLRSARQRAHGWLSLCAGLPTAHVPRPKVSRGSRRPSPSKVPGGRGSCRAASLRHLPRLAGRLALQTNFDQAAACHSERSEESLVTGQRGQTNQTLLTIRLPGAGFRQLRRACQSGPHWITPASSSTLLNSPRDCWTRRYVSFCS
jgi:hypothetical protein